MYAKLFLLLRVNLHRFDKLFVRNFIVHNIWRNDVLWYDFKFFIRRHG
jgi:hypothetical protein